MRFGGRAGHDTRSTQGVWEAMINGCSLVVGTHAVNPRRLRSDQWMRLSVQGGARSWDVIWRARSKSHQLNPVICHCSDQGHHGHRTA